MAKTTWVLVASAHRARCFEHDASSRRVFETVNFSFPPPQFDSMGRPDELPRQCEPFKGRMPHGRVRFSPAMAVGVRKRTGFSRQLADYINRGVATQRCDGVGLIASSDMLGELMPLLSQAADQRLCHAIAKDLTHLQGIDLAHRIDLLLGSTV
jgi:hypothetical protein